MTAPHESSPTVQQLFDLTGQVALVTGGTGFLGAAIAAALAESGARVVISSRERAGAEQAAAQLPPVAAGPHGGVQLDHKDEPSLEAGFRDAVALAGHVDILFNNGQSGAAQDWTDISGEQFQDHLRNSTGYFLLSRLLHQHVTARQAPGSIIMLGSMYGLVGSYPDAYAGVCAASSVAYHALKGGVIHMTRHLAVYWAQDRVRVNCLSPGPFPGPKAPREMVERLCTKSPMGRMGAPHELKGAAVFLASQASSYLTGHNLVVDGGWTAW